MFKKLNIVLVHKKIIVRILLLHRHLQADIHSVKVFYGLLQTYAYEILFYKHF